MARQDRAAAPGAAAAAAPIADAIVEAGWLLALALVPVFFNIQSGRPFEPDKTALLRLLAALMAAAGVALWVEERLAGAAKSEAARWHRTPLFACALVYLASAALSTVFSIVPSQSLWGSHARLEGLVTLLAHLVVFVGIATRLRRREQLQRLVDAAVVASLPVCAYGLLQRLGADPLDWRSTFQEERIPTTLGNPFFAGDYLALVLLVTLAGLRWWWGRRGDAGRTARIAVYGVAAAAQVVALALTGSRGPWLGAATALGAFALLHAAIRGRRRLAAATLAAGVAALAFLGLLNVPGGPLEPLRRGTVLGRLGRLFDDREGRNPADRARVLIWQGALRLMRLPAPIVVPGRGPDSGAGLRTIVGFGPETLQGVFSAVYDPAFARAERRNPEVSAQGASTFDTRVPDRSHNETLDSLVLGGVLGLLAHLLLHAGAQVTGLRALGLLGARRDRLLLAASCAAGVLVLTAVATLAVSWAYVGVSVPLGLVAGWMAFALVAALRRPHGEPPGTDAALVAGITAALLGHFVTIQFGPAVVTGRLYFWALAAVLVAMGRLAPAEDPRDDAFDPWWPVARAGPPAALGLVIAYGFAGLKAGGGGRAAYGTIALLAGTAIAAWAVLSARRWRTAAVAAALAAGVTAAYAGYHLHALAATSQVHTLPDLVAALSGHFTRIVLLVLLLAVATGIALGRPAKTRLGAGAVRLAAAVALVLVVAVPPTLGSVNADVLRNFAAAFRTQNRLGEAATLLDAAIRLAPHEALHQQALGETLVAATRLPDGAARAADLLTRAEAAFRRARELDPLGPDHTANLARLARRRSELDADPASARRRAEEAARFYAEAVALVPGNTLLLDESAELDFQRLGDFASAEGKLRRSIHVDPTFDYTHNALGDLYMARAKALGRREDYALAARAFQEAHALRNSVKALVGLGFAYKEMGDAPSAIRVFEQTLALPPPASTSWALHEQLAALYEAQGDPARASRHAAIALQQAPGREKGPLEARLRAARLLPS